MPTETGNQENNTDEVREDLQCMHRVTSIQDLISSRSAAMCRQKSYLPRLVKGLEDIGGKESEVPSVDRISTKSDKALHLDMESVILLLSETEGRLHQLRKQYDELATRYEQAHGTHLKLRQEADQAKAEANEMRRQLSAQVSLQLHQGETAQKWTSRVEKGEHDLADLRRSHDRLLALKTSYEEQNAQLQDLVEKKQQHVQSLQNNVTQLNDELNTKDQEMEEWKGKTVLVERKSEKLNTELLQATERLERLQDVLKVTESAQLAANERLTQQAKQHEESIKRYQEQMEKIDKQLNVYKKHTEDLTTRLDLSQKQKFNFTYQVEQLHKQLDDAIATNAQQTECVRENEKLLNQEAARIKELQQKLETQYMERCKLLDSISALTQEQTELKDQLGARDDRITQHEAALDSMRAQCEELVRLVEQKGEEKRVAIRQEREQMDRAQIKQTRLIRSLKLQAKCILTCVTRQNHLLLRRFRRMKYVYRLLVDQLMMRNDQMRRLSQILWDTGWDYTRTKYELALLAETLSGREHSGSLNLNNASIESATETSPGNENRKTQTQLSDEVASVLTWATIDLDSLVRLVQTTSKDRGPVSPKTNECKAEWLDPCIPTAQTKLNQWLLNFKTKIAWLRRQYRVLRDGCKPVCAKSEVGGFPTVNSISSGSQAESQNSNTEIIAQESGRRVQQSFEKLANNLVEMRKELSHFNKSNT